MGDFSSRLAANYHIPETITDSFSLSLDEHRHGDSLGLDGSTLFTQSPGSMTTANTLPELGHDSAPTSSSTPSEYTIGRRCKYQCLFHILDCDQSFEDMEMWKVHVLSHFGSHPAPTDARCPLCQSAVSDSQRDVAWETMLDHVAERHFQNGIALSWSRPDIELMRYLFKLRVITPEQFGMVQRVPVQCNPGYHDSQELAGQDVGCTSDPVCVSANPRRERRMRARRNG